MMIDPDSVFGNIGLIFSPVDHGTETCQRFTTSMR